MLVFKGVLANVFFLRFCLEGTFEQLLTLRFDSNNSKEFFYTSSRLKKIDLLHLKIKYPKEVKRKPRSLNDILQYKANEFKSLLINGIIYILK